ncbi:hypothetical protein AAW12_24330 [Sphingobacterium sp. Ag1]|uniref:helix-turn-helix domain-containing protein n=1 Tax=Sphingobacterium sp. Ag1 TaxID=1643451 RepID=UPI000627A5E4|nr:helix-turn-helix domain-containing protein [Sphingobacterium sp. Ag1]KKO89239.1 hypothetical protein AAW12_24330 [Sphingobacterium sp. Ag1]
MKKLLFICLSLLIILPEIYGQSVQEKEFDKRYIEVNVSLLATNVVEAERVADSLLRAAQTDEQKIKSYMLLAKLYENKGDMSSSIKCAVKANSLAEMTLNYSWQASTSGLLSTTFRRLGLMKVSERYLKEAAEANEKQKDKERQILTKINIAHEWFFHAAAENDYQKAKKYVSEAASVIRIESDDDKRAVLIKATNDQLRAICELHLGNLDAADTLLQASLNKLGNMDTNLKPYIFRIMAEVALARKNPAKAYEKLKLIDPYLEGKNVEELEMLTNQTWSTYYTLIGEPSRANDYLVRANNIKDKDVKIAQQISDSLLEEAGSTREVYYSRYIMAVGGILLVILFSIAIAGYLLLLKRSYKKRYLKLKELESTEPVVDTDQIITESALFSVKKEQDLKKEAKDINISKETEDRLYANFLREEMEQFYLDKTTSLNKLAGNMGTNQRYASYIIQKYRNTDFYTYLQSNRINYIIGRIKKDPTLLDFKLAHLAEMCGFASLSTFSTAFKNQTGLPPSAFVHFTKKDLESQL